MTAYPENQLVPSITSESVAELMIDVADTALDAAIDSGALDGIPVVGLATGTIRAARDIRQAFLVRKLARFLAETARLTAEERSNFKSAFHDEAQAEDFGGLVIVLLDRADDLEKPVILGRLLVAYARGAFSQSDFFRLARMVERSFTDDLHLLGTSLSGTCPARKYKHKICPPSDLSAKRVSMAETPAIQTRAGSCIKYRSTENGWCNMGLRPNNAFKPKLQRYANNMTDKACHVAGYALQFGLT